MAELVKDATPPCHLNPLLFNGHLQTAWTAVKDQDVPIYYKRTVFEAEDSAYRGCFAVDFVVPEFEQRDETLPPRTVPFTDDEFNALPSSDTRPMLVALHGLSGGSHELYLRHVLAPLVTPEACWDACVVNARGCALSKITTPVLFNARATWDVRQTIRWLRKTFPNRALFAIGFSLGANILTNYLGEEGAECVLKAAVVISNPWNLDISNTILQSTWLGLEVYSKTMGSNLKKLVEIHADQVSKNADVSLDRLRQTKYLHEFDREIQCPSWGYPTVGAYYRDASSCDSVLAVKTPLLAIQAEDDPIAVKQAIPYDEISLNPYVVLAATAHGGHLGWFEGSGGRWFVKPATNFLSQMAERQLEPEKDRNATAADAVPEKDVEGHHFEALRRKMDIEARAI
ncbi:MAG: hypothetical protein M1817_006605 [Caeruleum heppii]|nr:MAG: hypothetical protein M1817_006605 [Caeruleum heppii]